MDSIAKVLMEQLLSGDNLSQISNKIGADEKSTKSALEMAIPLLLAAMSKKASEPKGADQVLGSLSQVKGSDLSACMAGFLGLRGSSQGTDILNSILGSRMMPIQQAIAKKTGLPAPVVVGQLLSIALPMVLAALTRVSSKKNIGSNDLSKLLKEESNMTMSSSPEAALLIRELSSQDRGLMGVIKKLFRS